MTRIGFGKTSRVRGASGDIFLSVRPQNQEAIFAEDHGANYLADAGLLDHDEALALGKMDARHLSDSRLAGPRSRGSRRPSRPTCPSAVWPSFRRFDRRTRLSGFLAELLHFSENPDVLLVPWMIDPFFGSNEIVDLDPEGCDVTVLVGDAAFPGLGKVDSCEFL